MYLHEWSSQINLTSNNGLFKAVKSNFGYESYLDLNNRALRVSMTKIRLSSHIFLIERGRWGSNRIELNERRCNICNVIEDEFHCIVVCPRFNNERKGLLSNELMNKPSKSNFLRYLKTQSQLEQKK